MALYDAFISYSHANDKPIAAALQSAIQKLGKAWYRLRALRVFRDDTSLAATPHLWPTIEVALGQSRFFLLLASPEAAASKWVNKEVAHWLDHNTIDTLLIGLTDGELFWDEAEGDFAARKRLPLPPVLSGRFVTEPKWVDLTAYRDGADKGDAKFTELAANFAATIRGMPKEDLLSQEVGQQRRALTLAWSAAMSLFVLAGLAGWQWYEATIQRREAIAQRDRAERTLATATDTANGLILDLSQRFRDAVGMPVTLAKDILDRARKLQTQLTESGQVTLELKRSEVTGLNEMAATLLAIGDSTGALDLANRARQIMVELLATNPDDTNWQRALAVANVMAGEALEEQGRWDEALASYRKNLETFEQLAASDGANPHWQHDLAFAHGKIAHTLSAMGQYDEALASSRLTLDILDRLAAADRGNKQEQYDLSDAYVNLGATLMALDKLDEALASYRTAVEILEPLDPDRQNTQYQSGLSAALIRLGYVERRQGVFSSAFKHYKAALEIAQRLALSEPHNTQWQHELSVNYQHFGDVQVELDKLDEALASYHKSVAIAERLVVADRVNVAWQIGLVLGLGKLSNVSDRSEKTAALTRARDILDALERENRLPPQQQELREMIKESLAEIQQP